MRQALLPLVLALVGCNAIFGVERKSQDPIDSGYDAGPIGERCADAGSILGECGELCTDRSHCGACGVTCEGDELVECRNGACVDHAFAGWAVSSPVETPICTGSDIKVDARVGVMWLQDVPGLMTPADGEAHCTSLDKGGYLDWHLPTRVEVSTMLNYTLQITTLPDSDASKTQCSPPRSSAPTSTDTWCTRSHGPGTTDMFLAYAQDGHVELAPPTTKCRPRCIRAYSARPRERFTLTGDAVSDAVSGLEWKVKEVDAGDHTAAQSACASPWKLPTVKQLETIVDERTSPTIDRAVFSDGSPSIVWTIEEYKPKKGHYWAVDFAYGTVVERDGATSGGKVRCVRPR